MLLASASLAALVLTDDARRLRLAVVGALWAFLLVSITGRFRARTEEAPSESDEELRRFYQMELQQEVSARREYELRLEVQMRRELEESRTQEIEELRSEVHRLRAELMGIELPDRAALPASPSRTSPERLHAPHEEAARANGAQRRPIERLQLPAGFSDSPPPADAPSPYASVPAHDNDLSQPRLPGPTGGSPAGPEPYSPTEYVPAASHGTHGMPPEPSYAANGSAGAGVELPAAYAAPEEFTVVTPYGTPESSGVYGSAVPSPAWSSYASPPAPNTRQAGPAHGAHNGHDSSPSYPPVPADGSHPGYPPYQQQPPAAGAVVEPFGGGRHGTPSEASRPDPFDPSNTWPGAFKVSSEERMPMAPPPRDAEAYPAPQADWRPTEQPAEWRPADGTARGRHHAGDEPAQGRPAAPSGRSSRPEDDVLAQILGRW